jgi:hypothetical protein
MTYGIDLAAQRYRYLSLPAIIYCVSLLYAAVLILPAYCQPIVPGLDASWGFAVNYFPHSNFTFGPDLIFTYGPLGFIAVPQDIAANIGWAMAVRFTVWGIMLWQLARLWISGRHFPAAIIVASLIVSNKLYFYYWDYFLTATILVLFVRLFEEPPHYLELWVVTALMSVSFLVKFTAFVMAFLWFAAYTLGHLWLPGRLSSWRWRIAVLAGLASGPLAYLIYNPSTSGLILYIKGMLQIASGYAAWMSLPTPANIGIFGGAITAATVLCTLDAVRRRSLRAWPAIVVLLATWMSFRHGFVRSGEMHASVYCAFAILIFGVLLAQIKASSYTTVLYGVAFCGFTIIALVGVAWRWPVSGRFWWSADANFEQAQRLLRGKEGMAEFVAISEKAFHHSVVEQYKQTLNQSRVLIFPWDLAYAAGQNFELVPLYATQAYSAYTRYLDTMGAAKIRQAAPPIDYVLMEWKSIDGRHPLLDEPATWTTLYANYVPRQSQVDSMLLARRPKPLTVTYTPSASKDFHPGIWVQVPRSPTPEAFSIELRPTVVGTLMTAIYKLPLIFVEMRSLSGITQTYRVVGDVLTTPQPINCLPQSFEALRQLWSDNRPNDPIVALRLTGDGLSYMQPSVWRFYHVKGTDIIVPEAQQVEETFQQHFHLTSTSQIPRLLGGYISTVNGRAVSKLNDPNVPMRLESGEGAVIEGWMISGEAAKGFPMDELYAVVSGKVVRAETVARPDVAAHFQNPKFITSGYRIHLGEDLLRSGSQAVELIGRTQNDGALYRFPEKVYLAHK